MLFESILYLGALMLGAKLMGELFRRIHQPVLIGNVIAGIVIGPALFAFVKPSDEFTLFTSIGIFFLFFSMGVKIDLSYITRILRGRLVLGALAGFLIPFFVALVIGSSENWDLIKSLTISSVIAVTSMGVVAKVLIDLGRMQTALGLQIFTVGIIIELLGIIVTSILVQTEQTGFETATLGWGILKNIIFFAVAGPLCFLALPKFLLIVKRRIRLKYFHYGMIIALILVFAYFAEISAAHGAIGALMFGIAFTRINKEEFAESVSNINYLGHGYLIPLFFAGIGIYFNFDFVNLSILTIVGFLVFIPAIKLFSGYIAARITSIRPITPLTFAVMAKGGLDLELLRILLEAEIIDDSLFSLLVLASLITLTIAGIGMYRSLLKTPA